MNMMGDKKNKGSESHYLRDLIGADTNTICFSSPPLQFASDCVFWSPWRFQSRVPPKPDSASIPHSWHENIQFCQCTCQTACVIEACHCDEPSLQNALLPAKCFFVSGSLGRLKLIAGVHSISPVPEVGLSGVLLQCIATFRAQILLQGAAESEALDK